MFKAMIQICDMNETEKEHFVKMSGIILLRLCEGYNIFQIAKEFNIKSSQVLENIYIMNYILRRTIGTKNYLKQLFIR